MKYMLEEWSLNGGTLMQLEEVLLHLNMKYIIPGKKLHSASKLCFHDNIIPCNNEKNIIFNILKVIHILLNQKIYILHDQNELIAAI